MTISEETLMAFADGELDPAASSAVEVAMREDPDVARRVARHVALRNRLQSAFADELSEPLPHRLLSVVRASAGKGNNVVDLQEVRAAGMRAAQVRASSHGDGADQASGRTSWRQLGSIAAGVLLGLGIGYGMWRQGGVPIVRGTSGTLVANAQLAAALTTQLTAQQTGASSVFIGVSFLAKSGEYCRTFTLARAANATAVPAMASSGIACKDHQQWQIQALAQSTSQTASDFRTAATSVPPVILKLIEDEIKGEPLDAAGEAAALRDHWQSHN